MIQWKKREFIMAVEENQDNGKREPLQLRVAEGYSRDVSKLIARISSKNMERLGVQSGDIIELKGKSLTGAVVWRAHEEDDAKDIEWGNNDDERGNKGTRAARGRGCNNNSPQHIIHSTLRLPSSPISKND